MLFVRLFGVVVEKKSSVSNLYARSQLTHPVKLKIVFYLICMFKGYRMLKVFGAIS